MLKRVNWLTRWWVLLLTLTAASCTCEAIDRDSTVDGAQDAAPGDSGGQRDGAVDLVDDQAVLAGPYGSCPCGDSGICISTSCPTCAQLCFSLADCPQPAGGTAMPECFPQGAGGQQACMLLCGGGLVCPTGMHCDTAFSSTPVCLAPCK